MENRQYPLCVDSFLRSIWMAAFNPKLTTEESLALPRNASPPAAGPLLQLSSHKMKFNEDASIVNCFCSKPLFLIKKHI